MGLQKRIMLYVALGLLVLFAAFSYAGLRAIQRSTDLVYEERLSMAHSIAASLEQDLAHIVKDVAEEGEKLLSAGEGPALDRELTSVFNHLTATDIFPLFQVSSIWLVNGEGKIVAGVPPLLPAQAKPLPPARLQQLAIAEKPQVVEALYGGGRGSPFALVVVPLSHTGEGQQGVVLVHIESANNSRPFNPYGMRQAESQALPSLPRYHLEVISLSGKTVLAIGLDQEAGRESFHYPIARHLMAEGRDGVMLHRVPRGSRGKDHVMAMVPVPGAPLYVVLEQDKDVALALTNELRLRFILFGGLGLLLTLGVAYVTTRQVVRPTLALTQAAGRIAGGELATPIAVGGQDEIGNLADSLEVMRQRLQAALKEVEQSNQELENRVKERTARLEAVLGKVISAQEEERHRLARELHDETAQALAALSVSLEALSNSLPRRYHQALNQVAEARALVARLLTDTRRLIYDLRPTVLDDLGLVAAIRWYAETHLEEGGIKVELRVNTGGVRLPSYMEVALFRILQEAMANVVHHAAATEVVIELWLEDSVVRASVWDNGRGFDAEGVLRPGALPQGVGLQGIQERVSLLGGKLTIRSWPGGGTSLSLEVPLEREVAR